MLSIPGGTVLQCSMNSSNCKYAVHVAGKAGSCDSFPSERVWNSHSMQIGEIKASRRRIRWQRWEACTGVNNRTPKQPMKRTTDRYSLIPFPEIPLLGTRLSDVCRVDLAACRPGVGTGRRVAACRRGSGRRTDGCRGRRQSCRCCRERVREESGRGEGSAGTRHSRR